MFDEFAVCFFVRLSNVLFIVYFTCSSYVYFHVQHFLIMQWFEACGNQVGQPRRKQSAHGLITRGELLNIVVNSFKMHFGLTGIMIFKLHSEVFRDAFIQMQMLLLMKGKTVESTVHNLHYNKSLQHKQPFKQIHINNLLSEAFSVFTRVAGKGCRCLSFVWRKEWTHFICFC